MPTASPHRAPTKAPAYSPFGRTEYTVGTWTAGTNTTLSISGGRARATAVGINNPRISRQVSGLTGGQRYTVVSTNYAGTTGTILLRVASESNLTNADYGEFTGSGAVQLAFTAPSGGVVYIGIVGGSTTADGQYAETAETFTLD